MHAVLHPNGQQRHAREWVLAFALGALLGALILGGGGRLAMRGITLWEDRPHQFTAGGTLSVLAFGAAFGVLGAGLRAAIDFAVRRWLPARAPRRAPGAAFAVVCLAIACVLLTPLTAHRLVLFPPVVVLYVVALERFWRGRAEPRDRVAPLAHVVSV
jgi:hypothetical protein